MNYIIKVDNNMVKYSVDYDEELLRTIKSEIIDKCGFRQHFSYDTVFLDNYKDYNSIYIKNFKKTDTKKLDNFGRKIYHVEYDEIERPMLVSAIDSFLAKDSQKILEYICGDDSFKKSDAHNKIKELYERKIALVYSIKKLLDTVITNDKEKFEELGMRIKELENIMDNIDLNKNLNLKNQVNYLDLLKESFTLTKLDEIDYNTYQKVMNFNK